MVAFVALPIQFEVAHLSLGFNRCGREIPGEAGAPRKPITIERNQGSRTIRGLTGTGFRGSLDKEETWVSPSPWKSPGKPLGGEQSLAESELGILDQILCSEDFTTAPRVS